jgi:hypothetical protein
MDFFSLRGATFINAEALKTENQHPSDCHEFATPMKALLPTLTAVAISFSAWHDSTQATEPQPRSEEADVDEEPANFNLPMITAGGTQVWTDHRWRDGYRVQQNSLTGHWRLLDADNIRRAWGSKPQCLTALDQRCPKPTDAAPKHRIVLLHGLMRTSGSMKPLERSLAEHDLPDTIRFSYASTRAAIGLHAAALRELLEDLPQGDTFSFVGHSMGNIVVRHLIGDLQRDGDAANLLPRCRTMVMLGPPNQGAAIARRLAPTGLFGWITGEGGMELGAYWDKLKEQLAVPPFPFHIIAGDLQTPINNPLLDGNGDFIVGVDEARLEGAASFQTVPVLHSFLMDNEQAIDKTIELLKSPSPDPPGPSS